MRKLMYLLCFLLISCNLQVQDFEGGFTVPPQSTTVSDLRLLILTDLHIGKDGIDDGREAFLTWLEENPDRYDRIIVLGDLTQCGLDEQMQEAKAFLDEASRVGGCDYIALIGNHDIRNDGRRDFENLFSHDTYYSFGLGGYSFYVLDTADRLVGLDQLNSFKETVANDSNVKIALSHMPIYCGTECIEASLCDPCERYELLDTLLANNFELYLCGHNHFNASEQYNNGLMEISFATFCGLDRIFESHVKWNELILNQSLNVGIHNSFSLLQDGSIEVDEIERFALTN